MSKQEVCVLVSRRQLSGLRADSGLSMDGIGNGFVEAKILQNKNPLPGLNSSN